jgi:hypothetical protein
MQQGHLLGAFSGAWVQAVRIPYQARELGYPIGLPVSLGHRDDVIAAL